ncbi:MAG: Lrp/AsnC family transcriptional regulator [Deltaproteobacteria bacterium]|jgi:DNA-binding Lrp family transcriptional regulator|nr:Lrp/AsnC family transcriptional regulator [Deltaproteobacteria bacterium]
MSPHSLSATERLILNDIQDRFPAVSRPFQEVAERLNKERGLALTEEEVLEKVAALKKKGYFRRLGAIFNSRPLGYLSTLCAAKVPPEKIEEFGALVNSYPQTTHNYVRNNPLNLWFTFCYADPMELESFLRDIREKTGITAIFELKSRKIFKIRAVFDVT